MCWSPCEANTLTGIISTETLNITYFNSCIFLAFIFIGSLAIFWMSSPRDYGALLHNILLNSFLKKIHIYICVCVKYRFNRYVIFLFHLLSHPYASCGGVYASSGVLISVTDHLTPQYATEAQRSVCIRFLKKRSCIPHWISPEIHTD